MEEILLEKKLTTEFTMGFELEAIWRTYNEDSDDDYDSYNEYEDEINELFDRTFPGGDLHGDGSVHGEGEGVGFEWASPILPFNVATIQKIINFYRRNLGNKFSVNNTCGYHHHISFPGISVEDVVWIMCKLALDDRMRDLISNFEGIEFVSGWSGDEYLDDLREAILNNNYGDIVRLCNTQKYSLVNVHRNKTLEWRGPRGFLNREDPDIIIKFYKRLHQFVTWITDVLDENEINGVSKENFLDLVRAALPNDKKIGNFSSSKKIKGLMSPETLQKFINEIVEDNTRIFKFINMPKQLEQIIQRLYNLNRLGFIVKRLNENTELNEGNILLLNNICWKYIPYRMGIDYMDKISADVVADSSKLTMDRLWATSRKDGNSVSYSDKFTVLTKALNKIPTIDIIKPSRAPKLYEATADWSNGFETLVKINEGGWIDRITDIPRCFQTCSQALSEAGRTHELETMIEIFKGKVNFKDYFALYGEIFASDPAKYIDIIETLDMDEIEGILGMAKRNGTIEKTINIFKQNNIINEVDEVRIMSELTNAARDNINQMIQ